MESVGGGAEVALSSSAQNSPRGATATLNGLLRRNSGSERSLNDKLRKIEQNYSSVDVQMIDMRQRLSSIENTLVEILQAVNTRDKVAVGDSDNGFQMLPMGVDEDEKRRAVCCACWQTCLDMFC